MVGIPSTPYDYMPNQPIMVGTPHYGNTPGYGQPQAPISQATGAYQLGVPTNRHTFPSQMAQGAANPNFTHRQDILKGGYQNQPFILNPSHVYDQPGGVGNGKYGIPREASGSIGGTS